MVRVTQLRRNASNALGGSIPAAKLITSSASDILQEDRTEEERENGFNQGRAERMASPDFEISLGGSSVSKTLSELMAQ